MSSRGVNKCILIGNACADPETRFMPSGGAVTNVTIATNEKWKDRQTGQMQERAEFHRLVFFNKLGEIAGEYLKKGSKVYIEGSIRTRKWQGQDGQDRYTTEIVANEMQMLDGRSDGQSGQQDYRGHTGSNQANPTYGQNQAPAQGGGFQPPTDDFETDSDIPF